jgi:putative ABC transport system permease protein
MGFLDDLRQDLRFAARGLLRSRGFTAVAVLAIALGIGANSAIFSVVNAVLLRPLPYRDPDRLVTVLHQGPSLPRAIERSGAVAPAHFLEWRAQSQSFERMGAAQAGGGNASLTMTLTGRGTPEELRAMSVTADLFPVLGVDALLGRTLGPGDDQPGAPPAAVISHRLWQGRFGGDPRLVGQTITAGGKTFTVVGVMPPSFRFAPFWFTGADLWVPLVLGDPAHNRLADRGGRSLRVFARLRPGVTPAQAEAEMQRLWGGQENLGVAVDLLHEKMVRGVRRPLLVLLAAVGFVLLIACANVANLLLARAAGRAREMALRTALGASRARLVRQLLVESLLLALGGGALAVLLGQWGIEAVAVLGPRDLPRAETIRLDGAVLAFTAGLSLLTGLLFGLLPALRSAGSGLGQALNEGGRGTTEGGRAGRLRGALVVAEVALALVLLIGAGLMIKSFRRLQAVEPGFDPRHLLSMVVQVPADPARRERFVDRLLEHLRALPGVVSASATNHLPIGGDVWAEDYEVEGQPVLRLGDAPTAIFRIMRPGYLGTMGIPLLRGRDFTEGDRLGAPPVLIVNEAFARRAWPEQEAVGKRVNTSGSWHEVVGVTRDARQKEWTEPATAEMYFPERQQSVHGYLTVVMRTAGEVAGLAALAQREVTALDADLAAPTLVGMEQVIALSLWQPRFSLLLLNLFAALSLLLSGVGIYGVMAHAVSHRTREIGVRVALGATVGQIHRLVVGQGMRLALVGVALGVAAALGATRLMAALLFGVGPSDPATFLLVPVLLLGVALLACYLPARRATRLDPMIALRHE